MRVKLHSIDGPDVPIEVDQLMPVIYVHRRQPLQLRSSAVLDVPPDPPIQFNLVHLEHPITGEVRREYWLSTDLAYANPCRACSTPVRKPSTVCYNCMERFAEEHAV